MDDLCDMHIQYNPNFCGAEQGHGACREVAHPTETDPMGEPRTDTARSDKSEESFSVGFFLIPVELKKLELKKKSIEQ